MSRYFVEKGAQLGGMITIRGEDFHHIKNVLRARPGDSLIVCDAQGTDYHVSIKQIYKDALEACVEDSSPVLTEPPMQITLYQGLPKGDKLELIIQKCVELGIDRIVPVQCERSVVKLNKGDHQKKVERWQKIAFEAAKQCNRGRVPQIGSPVTFEDAVSASKSCNLRLMPYEKQSPGGLKALLMASQTLHAGIAMYIGPEGGFAEGEVAFAIAQGVQLISLGPRILRTETAGLALLSVLMYVYGDMGSFVSQGD